MERLDRNAKGRRCATGVFGVTNGREVTLGVIDQSERYLRAIDEAQ